MHGMSQRDNTSEVVSQHRRCIGGARRGRDSRQDQCRVGASRVAAARSFPLQGAALLALRSLPSRSRKQRCLLSEASPPAVPP
eukprot:70990-Chlamydomonas_euryale.AAC.1